MKILLTGYKGFIGSNMLNMLRKNNYEVYTFNWGENLCSLEGLDWVIHVGAISSTTERDVEKIMLQNFDFSCNLLDACIKNKINFQYSSSASVYGLLQEFKESSPVDPRTPYAWSKYMFERYASKQKTSTFIQGFRYFNVYGPNEESKLNQASPYTRFEKQFRDTGKIEIFENSEVYKRDFIHVDKVCKMHIDFLTIPESGIYNCGSGHPESFYDIALKFTTNIETIKMPEILKNNYQKYTCADMTHTYKTLAKYKGENYELGR